MDPRSLEYVAAACEGELRSGSPGVVSRVCTDSRRIQSGDLFIALRGDSFDGHDFLREAAAKGAAAMVIETGKASVAVSCPVIVVDNTRRALGRLASRYRRGLQVPAIAVAGSNGKTTTKDLIASVLSERFSTLASESSFNNDVGVPLTLLKLEAGHQAAVLEAGTNHPGELAPLLRMIQPQYGVLTNIGREHLEFFGGIEGVAEEEGWLAELLPGDGRFFANGDSEWTERIARRSKAPLVRVGTGERNDWRLRGARLDTQGVTFGVDAPDREYVGEYRVAMLGRHQALNALFAIAVGAMLGVGAVEIRRGLLACKPARMRLQFWESNGVRVLDDAYNANADSMLAALRTLHELPCKGRRVAVLGDMAELGSHAEAAHEEVGRCAAEAGVGQLFAIGKMAPILARGARLAGLHRVFEFSDVDAAGHALMSFVRKGDVLLLKASRATRLERLAELLRAADCETRN